MPNEYFYKIKNESNILNHINMLFNKIYDNEYVIKIDINNDKNNFINFVNNLIN